MCFVAWQCSSQHKMRRTRLTLDMQSACMSQCHCAMLWPMPAERRCVMHR